LNGGHCRSIEEFIWCDDAGHKQMSSTCNSAVSCQGSCATNCCGSDSGASTKFALVGHVDQGHNGCARSSSEIWAGSVGSLEECEAKCHTRHCAFAEFHGDWCRLLDNCELSRSAADYESSNVQVLKMGLFDVLPGFKLVANIGGAEAGCAKSSSEIWKGSASIDECDRKCKDKHCLFMEMHDNSFCRLLSDCDLSRAPANYESSDVRVFKSMSSLETHSKTNTCLQWAISGGYCKQVDSIKWCKDDKHDQSTSTCEELVTCSDSCESECCQHETVFFDK